MNEIRDYIDRAKSAQQKHDERPGTQLAIAIEDYPLFLGCVSCGRENVEVNNDALCSSCIVWMNANPNQDCDPGDCNDYRGV